MKLKEKIIRFLAEQPKPGLVLQFSPSYVAAIRTQEMNRSWQPGNESLVVRPLPAGVLEASYLKPNLKGRDYLEKVLDDILHEIKPEENSVNLLIPEMSGRVFIFSLENGLKNPDELNQFVEWSLHRQLGQNISQIRYPYQVFNSVAEKKILVLCAAEEVVKEYESLFKPRKMKVGKISLPSLSVLNLLLGEPEREADLLVVDLDYDYLSLVAVAREGFLLYRQKPVWPDKGKEETVKEAAREIENTVNFIEDKLKRKLTAIYLRSNLDRESRLEDNLQTDAPIKVKKIRPGHEQLVPLLGGL